MKVRLLFIGTILFTSCFQQKQEESKTEAIYDTIKVKHLSKLEKLMSIPKDSLILYYDLSNDSIKVFPNLSSYRIKKLNLSCNSLDTLISEYLPKELVSINLSHNNLSGELILRLNRADSLSFKEREFAYESSTIKEFDLSHNSLTAFLSSFRLRKLVISYNNLSFININWTNLQYLDISHNPKLSNYMTFPIRDIDSIKRKGIANNEELVYECGSPSITCPIPDSITTPKFK